MFIIFPILCLYISLFLRTAANSMQYESSDITNMYFSLMLQTSCMLKFTAQQMLQESLLFIMYWFLFMNPKNNNWAQGSMR